MPTAPTFVTLAPRQLHGVPDACGVRISCRAGAVWITLDNDPKDYVLEAGESFVTPRHARALVYAIGTARIDLEDLQCQSRKQTMPMFSRFHAMPLMKAAR